MSAATQPNLPSRIAVRWYQLVVIVLGLALAAVIMLAVHLAVNDPTAAAVPPSISGAAYSATDNEQPCYQPPRPC